MSDSEWEKVKKDGSEHYKGGIEPIDLYKSGGMLRNFALCSIIKYAYRNRDNSKSLQIKDMEKIIHFAKIMIASERKND